MGITGVTIYVAVWVSGYGGSTVCILTELS